MFVPRNALYYILVEQNEFHISFGNIFKQSVEFVQEKQNRWKNMDKLKLYYAEGGPASRAVVLTIKELNLDVEFM